MQDEKVTIQVAAKALNVTPKTVHQWLRTGTLTRVKDGNRTYIFMDEVRALRQNRVTNPKGEVITFEAKNEQVTNQGYDMVPIKREHYEGLLTRLGQLEASQQLLLEYKEGLQAKERELSETKATLAANTEKLAGVKSALDANNAELDQARETISKARAELEKMVQLKQDTQRKDKVVLDQQAALKARERELADLRAELERARLPWWKKLLKK